MHLGQIATELDAVFEPSRRDVRFSANGMATCTRPQEPMSQSGQDTRQAGDLEVEMVDVFQRRGQVIEHQQGRIARRSELTMNIFSELLTDTLL